MHTEPRVAWLFLLASRSPRPGERCRYPAWGTPMKLLLLCFALLSIGCSNSGNRPAAPHGTGDESVEETSLYPDDSFDSKLAKNVPVVLRVKVTQLGIGSKYHWTTVDALRVVKNSSIVKIPKSLNIAATSWGQGLPVGTCTVYLVRYNDTSPECGWKLYEPDDSSAGYTHPDAG